MLVEVVVSASVVVVDVESVVLVEVELVDTVVLVLWVVDVL